MANVLPFREHRGIEPNILSTWKLHVDTLISLTDWQLPANDNLTNADNNNILYAHLDVAAARRFDHNPVMSNIGTITYANLYQDNSCAFKQQALPASGHVPSSPYMQTDSWRINLGVLVKISQFPSRLWLHQSQRWHRSSILFDYKLPQRRSPKTYFHLHHFAWLISIQQQSAPKLRFDNWNPDHNSSEAEAVHNHDDLVLTIQ